jgi:GNAT superfamily N-acetyltransferase
MNSDQICTIAPATFTDIPGMQIVLEQNLIRNKPDIDLTQLAAQGFLVNPITAEEFNDAITHPAQNIVLVAKQNAEVIGYIIGHDSAIAHLHITPIIQKLLSTGKVLYHRHIARKSNYKGVGKKLLQALLEQAATKGYQYVICKIVHGPWHNKVSIAVHQQLGFELIDTGSESNFEFGLYSKKL